MKNCTLQVLGPNESKEINKEYFDKKLKIRLFMDGFTEMNIVKRRNMGQEYI